MVAHHGSCSSSSESLALLPGGTSIPRTVALAGAGDGGVGDDTMPGPDRSLETSIHAGDGRMSRIVSRDTIVLGSWRSGGSSGWIVASGSMLHRVSVCLTLYSRELQSGRC